MNLSSELKTRTASVVLSKNDLASKDSASSEHHAFDSELNLLIDASAATFEHIHRITQHHPNDETKLTLTQFLETLQQHYQQLGYSQDTSIAAHYAICATLDDILRQHTKHSLHTATQHTDDTSFLHHFHQSRLESEKFYSILEHISTQPDKYIDLLELMYLCLRFGYKGQYRNTPFGLQQWSLLTDNTYRLITQTKGQHSHILSPDLNNTTPITLPATSLITKKRRHFYLLTSLIFVVLVVATGFIFKQTYNATQSALATPTTLATAPQQETTP